MQPWHESIIKGEQTGVNVFANPPTLLNPITTGIIDSTRVKIHCMNLFNNHHLVFNKTIETACILLKLDAIVKAEDLRTPQQQFAASNKQVPVISKNVQDAKSRIMLRNRPMVQKQGWTEEEKQKHKKKEDHFYSSEQVQKRKLAEQMLVLQQPNN